MKSNSLRQAEKAQKKMNKLHKKIRKEITKDLDFTDKVELTAFAYLESVNETFDSIVAWMADEEEHNKNNR